MWVKKYVEGTACVHNSTSHTQYSVSEGKEGTCCE